ncbi:MAG TPA: PEGA domain-containing protein [Polyangiaceae bacterium]
MPILRRPCAALLSVVFVAASVPARAFAQGPAPVTAPASGNAAELKKRGDDAMDSLRYADAVSAYEQAYAISKDPALLYNEGRAQQALGNFPEALKALERFAAEAPPELRARVPKLDELIAEVRKHVARLAIRCGTRGARVLIRDRVVGTTPLSGPLDLDSGSASLEVDADGYEAYKRDIDLGGGTQTVLDVQLVPKRMTTLLRVASTAASAVVSIDGKPYGNAPVEAVVQPGSHKVALHQAGYDDTESSVVVQLGEHKEVTIEPQKSAPVTSKWWFWTGVGVVVAGGVVTAIALTTDKKAGTGDSFSPSQVSAPLTRF